MTQTGPRSFNPWNPSMRTGWNTTPEIPEFPSKKEQEFRSDHLKHEFEISSKVSEKYWKVGK